MFPFFLSVLLCCWCCCSFGTHFLRSTWRKKPDTSDRLVRMRSTIILTARANPYRIFDENWSENKSIPTLWWKCMGWCASYDEELQRYFHRHVGLHAFSSHLPSSCDSSLCCDVCGNNAWYGMVLTQVGEMTLASVYTRAGSTTLDRLMVSFFLWLCILKQSGVTQTTSSQILRVNNTRNLPLSLSVSFFLNLAITFTLRENNVEKEKRKK